MQSHLRGSNECFNIIAMYTRCSTLERLELWNDLENVAKQNHISWPVRGDFNTIVEEANKLGGLLVAQ